MMCIKYSENIICVLKVRHKIHHLYIPLTFGGYKQTDLNSFLLLFSLSLSFINLFILYPSLSHLILLFTCMRTAGLIA